MKKYLLLFLMAFYGIAQIPGTYRVTGPVAPPATNSNFGATDTIYGKGGLVTGFSSLSQAQDPLRYPLGRRQLGMQFSLTDGTTYQLQTATTNYVNITPIYTNSGVGYNINLLGNTALETANADEITSDAFIANYDGVAAPNNYNMPKSWITARSTAIDCFLTNILALPILSTVTTGSDTNGVPREAIVLENEWPGLWRYDPFSLSDTNGANIRYPDSITTNTTQGRWDFVSSTRTVKTVPTLAELAAVSPLEFSSIYPGTNSISDISSTVFVEGRTTPQDGFGDYYAWVGGAAFDTDSPAVQEGYVVNSTASLGYWVKIVNRNDSVTMKPFILANLYGLTNYWALGDSHTRGQVNLTTNWAPAGFLAPQDIYVGILSDKYGLNLTNRSVSGSTISYNPAFSATRQSTMQQANVIPLEWEGIVTAMHGYNDSGNNGPPKDVQNQFRLAWESLLGRLYAEEYTGPDGKYRDGSTDSSFSSSISFTDQGFAGQSQFPTADPATDTRKALVLSGTDSITWENSGNVVVWADRSLFSAAATNGGGTFTIYTNGVACVAVNTYGLAYSYPVFTRLPYLDSSVTLSITNTSGTNSILAVGRLIEPSEASKKLVVLAGPIAFGNAPSFLDEWAKLINGSAAQAAQAFRDYPVWFSDVNTKIDVPTMLALPDPNHPNPAGQQAIALGMEAAARAESGSSTLAFVPNSPALEVESGYFYGILNPDRAKPNINIAYDRFNDEAYITSGDYSNYYNSIIDTSLSPILYTPINYRGSLHRLTQGGLQVAGFTSGSDLTNRVGAQLDWITQLIVDTNVVVNTNVYPHIEQTNLVYAAYLSSINWDTNAAAHFDSLSLRGAMTYVPSGPLRVTGAAPTENIHLIDDYDNSGLQLDWVNTIPQYGRIMSRNFNGITNDVNNAALNIPYYLRGLKIEASKTEFGVGLTNELINMNASIAGSNTLAFQQTNVTKWFMGMSAATNFFITRNDSSGVHVNTPITIDYVTGQFQFNSLASPRVRMHQSGMTVDSGGGFQVNGVWTGTTGLNSAASITMIMSGGGGFIDGINPVTGTKNPLTVRATTLALSPDTSLTLGTSGTSMVRMQHGLATLNTGAVTVANTSVTANSRIFVQSQSDGGTPGLRYAITRSAGASFTITAKDAANADQTADTSTVAWQLIEP